MREIKFRVWDKEIKKIILVSPNWFINNEVSNTDFSKLAEEDNCILMQYTGLKDKNGKEIYEGDIVRFMNEVPDKMMLYKVEWNNEEARFAIVVEHVEYGKYFGRIDEIIKNIEVIGNIYENPELLK